MHSTFPIGVWMTRSGLTLNAHLKRQVRRNSSFDEIVVLNVRTLQLLGDWMYFSDARGTAPKCASNSRIAHCSSHSRLSGCRQSRIAVRRASACPALAAVVVPEVAQEGPLDAHFGVFDVGGPPIEQPGERLEVAGPRPQEAEENRDGVALFAVEGPNGPGASKYFVIATVPMRSIMAEG